MSAWFARKGEFPNEKPSILLLMSSRLDEASARYVGAGCEEEGVPLCWDYQDGKAEELSSLASVRSRLEVGVGLDAEGGSISLLKIPGGSYLQSKGVSPAELRWIGQAAARLSKGEPLPVEDNMGGGIRYE